jgi:hypothetical protein
MIYREQLKVPYIHFINGDYRDNMDFIRAQKNVVIVTDPPFNIGYHYKGYNDNMPEDDYFKMLSELLGEFPCVIVHYPEQLHRLSVYSGKVPERVCSWVYNSNTAKQHRDVAFYGVIPDMTKTLQEYKNLSDKRIQERIKRGIRGGEDVRLVER